MTTKPVAIRKVGSELKELLLLVEEGTEIILIKDDTLIARLIFFHQRHPAVYMYRMIVTYQQDATGTRRR